MDVVLDDNGRMRCAACDEKDAEIQRLREENRQLQDEVIVLLNENIFLESD